MSRVDHIDNRQPEPLFEFDCNELLLTGLYHLEASAREPHSPSTRISGPTDMRSALKASSSILDADLFSPDAMEDMDHPDPKGKGISQPLFIRTHPTLEDRQPVDQDENLFSMSFGLATSSSIHEVVASPESVSSRDVASSTSGSPRSPTEDIMEDHFQQTASSSLGKGKARDIPPTLPPLSFDSTELNYGSSNWPTFSSSIPGPSSFDSSYGSVGNPDPAPSPSTSVADSPRTPRDLVGEVPVLDRIPPRARSLSSVSTQSKRSISALSVTKSKMKLSGTGNLARKLLGKQRDSPTSPSREIALDPDVPGCAGANHVNCLAPWTYNVTSRISPLAIPALEAELGFGEFDKSFPMYCTGRTCDRTVLRTKGRSYSSPLPLPTAFDLVPLPGADIFDPVPQVAPEYFDKLLPNELKLAILIALVALHETEHQRLLDDGTWTLRQATSTRNRWTGRDRGIRELFKLSRVSKAWHTLVFDGQLWMKLDLCSFSVIPPPTLELLAKTAGSFVRHLDLRGHAELHSATLLEITSHLCTEYHSGGDIARTNLTTINLQGCTALEARSLHHLLVRSPNLLELRLRGLAAVTDVTCNILSSYCQKLVSLDLSRCPNVSGHGGIYKFASAALVRDDHLRLKELRLSGLRGISDGLLEVLGRAAPELEVLDLSYCRELHNYHLEALVTCSAEKEGEFEMVQLTSREVGRDPTDATRHWRRVTRLRHLNLSACIMLTDHACSHLAHAVPRLEFLEMAGIGAELHDDGLVRLLETTPCIRKLDLEDACEITDDVLVAITPEPVAVPSNPRARVATPRPQPGHALEHLTVSYATELTNDALLALIRNCARLRVFEVDNTHVSESVVREFVRLARERKATDAQIAAVDCRSVSERMVRDLTEHTRPRVGWRAFDARKLGFLDARDDEALGVGQDELGAHRVALKTFFSWQTVDAVRAAREKKHKSTRRGHNSSSSSAEGARSSSPRARWWSPSGRRSGGTSPVILDLGQERDGCTIM